jgi:hypothetical protein
LSSASASESALRERVEKALTVLRGSQILRSGQSDRAAIRNAIKSLTADPTGQEGESE